MIFPALLVYLLHGEVLALYAFRLRSRIATMSTPGTDTVHSIATLARHLPTLGEAPSSFVLNDYA